MSLRARVGRHTNEGGRQCQNWADDQQTVTDLLNRIAADNGGAAGSLNAPIRPGVCGDALYAAIVQFETKHFPRQSNGYVDPGGAMLKRMEDLAAPAETLLDVLRRNVLDIANVVAGFHGTNRWTFGDRVQLDGLVQMAVSHIDTLKKTKNSEGKPLETLPWYGEVFGRVFFEGSSHNHSYGFDGDMVVVYDSGGRSRKVDAMMKYGFPVDRNTRLVTTKIPALLLFGNGVCFPMSSMSMMASAEAHEEATNEFTGW